MASQRILDADCELLTRWGLDQETATAAVRLALYSEGVLNERLHIISGARTCDEQRRLHAQGRGAVPGFSAHQVGRAFDVGFDFDPAPHIRPSLDAFARCIGLRAGGLFTVPDPGHYDLHPAPGRKLVSCE